MATMRGADALSGFRVDGKVALVTGGASGIGFAAASLLADAGARVFVLDRDAAAAEKAAAKIGGETAARTLDVADETAILRVFAEIDDAASGIDILVNNAGATIRRPAVDQTLEEWNQVLAVNMTGAFLAARTAARHMLARMRGGAIVSTGSIMGLSGGGLYPNISYQTTKGAIVNMTRALAVEWAKDGIRVNAVAPTYVRTPFIAPLLAKPELVAAIERMTPLGRMAEPEEVAPAILFLASPAAAMITGHTLPVDGGFLAQ
ncbi:MAG TPA: glucose 1-dehydrogenase [Acetobacteraceae bacterium]|nr:glucose 1-dehydrogenase [Acetobacteraceae bacterium]